MKRLRVNHTGHFYFPWNTGHRIHATVCIVLVFLSFSTDKKRAGADRSGIIFFLPLKKLEMYKMTQRPLQNNTCVKRPHGCISVLFARLL